MMISGSHTKPQMGPWWPRLPVAVSPSSQLQPAMPSTSSGNDGSIPRSGVTLPGECSMSRVTQALQLQASLRPLFNSHHALPTLQRSLPKLKLIFTTLSIAHASPSAVRLPHKSRCSHAVTEHSASTTSINTVPRNLPVTLIPTLSTPNN